MSTDHDTPMTDDSTDENETLAETTDQSPNTGDWERAPQDFESDIDSRAVTVPDYPVKVFPKVKGAEKEASAYLVSQGEIEEYLDEAPEDADATQFGREAIVELLNEHYVSPDFNLNVEDYRQAPAGYYDEFVNQILPEMGN